MSDYDVYDYESDGDNYNENDDDEGEYSSNEDKPDIEEDKDDDASEDENEDIGDRLQRYLCYRYDDTYILKYIQKKPMSVRKLSRNRDYPLHIACHYNHPDNLVMKLIDLFPMAAHQLSDKGEYPLHRACDRNQSEAVVMKLIETFPMAARQANNRGEYPLHLACSGSEGQSETVVMKLIELYPLAARESNRNAYYPLHFACSGNEQSVSVVMKLLEIFPEAAFKPVDCFAYYALHLACKSSLPEVVIKKLVEINPAALGEKTGDYVAWYPIHCVINSYEHGHHSIALIRLILDADPRANAKQTSKGESPLLMALKLGLKDVVECILLQSPVNIKDKDMMTTLHRVCGYYKFIDIGNLLQHPDIDINARDKSDETPLHRAARTDHLRTIQQLLDQPLIDINPTNNRNKTPLDLVEERIQKAVNHHVKLNAQLRISVKDLLKIEKLEETLQLLMKIKNLFVEYPVKRRWISYQYYFRSQLDL